VKSHVVSSQPPLKPSVDEACPICRSAETAACFSGRDRLFGLAQGQFQLLRCLSCKCMFLHPFPEDAALASFYPQKYWVSEESTEQKGWVQLFQRFEKAYREFVVADHVRFLDQSARKNHARKNHARENRAQGKSLLDIGCGSGTFLHVAQSHGFFPHGMDMSPQAVEIAKKQYGFTVRQGEIGSRIWDDCRFDFITMFHVLEHLTDPRLALEYAADLLQPRGILIIQVPNISSIQARLFGKLWYGLDVPRHVINFTPKALKFLLQETGFEFRLTSRFSLRDNPASIASSLVPWLDPIRRKVRSVNAHPAFNGAMETAYFALYLLALPAAYLESICGFGGTIWACARRRKS
jgi:2-polyprenyl-3-methyl-5-hydroxy-6-metoxy-1,4-benzoquinol methylase